MKSPHNTSIVQAHDVSELIGNKGTFTHVATGSHTKIAVKAGEKYNFKKAGLEKAGDDVIATKEGNNLYLKYADGTQLSLEGFYVSENSSVELSIGDNGSHVIDFSDKGMSLSEGSNYVYSHGNSTTLMSMAAGDSSLMHFVSTNSMVANLPHYAEAAAVVATDAIVGSGATAGAVASTGLSTMAMVGGAVVVGGITLASGSSSSSAASDTTPPSAPTINTVAGNDIITGAEKTAGVSVSGTAEAGSTVSVTWGSTTKTATATNGSYSVSFASTEIPADGTMNITATARDTAGNTSSIATHNVTVDTTTLEGSVADGYVQNAAIWIDTNKDGVEDFNTGLTTDAQGKFVLDADVPSGNIIAIGGTNIDTGLPNTLKLKAPEGSTVINPLTTLMQEMMDADLTLTPATASAKIVSALGITSGTDLSTYDPLEHASDSNAITTQKGAAAIATILSFVQDKLDTSASNTVMENLVDTISWATGAANLTSPETLNTLLNGISLENQARGELLNAMDAINSASDFIEIANAQEEVLDTTPSTSPWLLLPILNDLSDSGLKGDNVSNDVTPDFTLVAKSGGTLSYTVNGGASVAAGSAMGTGQVITLAGINEGLNTVVISVSDGIESVSRTVTFTLDTTLPNLNVNTVATDNIINTAEKGAGVTLSGTVESGATVTVNGNTAIVNGTTWSYILTPSAITVMGEDSETLNIIATDTAGNFTQIDKNITIDTQAYSIGVDSVTSNNILNSIEVAAGGSISGTTNAPDNQTITVKVDGNTLGTASASAGVWSLPVSSTTLGTLAQGNHTIVAEVLDSAGNSATQSHVFSVDTSGPSIPNISGISPDSGINIMDRITNVSSGVLTGTAEANSTVKVYVNTAISGTPTFTTTADTNGNWSVSYSNLSEGIYTAIATATDGEGNTSGASNASSITIDTTAPTKTVAITGNEDDIPLTGAKVQIAEGGLTNDNVPLITGTISAIPSQGEQIWLYDNGVKIGSAHYIYQEEVGSTPGSWYYAPSGIQDIALFADGVHSITARVVDVAGNAGVQSASRSFTVDATAPTAVPNITTNTALRTNDDTPLIVGTLTASLNSGEVVKIYEGTTYLGNATVSGTTWSFSPSATMSVGDHTFTAQVEDTAGNQGVVSYPYTVTIDQTIPAITSTTVNGSQVTILFDENIDVNQYQALVSMFSVSANGTPIAVSNVVTNNQKITLNLASAVKSGDTVTLSYTDPTAGDDTAALQDVAGNDIATFTNRPLINETSSGAFYMLGDGQIVINHPIVKEMNLTDLLLQHNGEMIMTGDYLDPTTNERDITMVRLTQDGRINEAFDSDGVALNGGTGIDLSGKAVMQPDGKILIADTKIASSDYDIRLVRFNADGTSDTSFGTNGVVTKAINNDVNYNDDKNPIVTLLPDGKILVGAVTQGVGDSPGYNIVLLRYNANGTPDTTFDADGMKIVETGSFVNDIDVLPNGNILVTSANVVHMYDSTGTLVSSFGTNGILSTSVNGSYGTTFLSDGKILVMGTAGVARYNADWTLDTTFGTNGILSLNTTVYTDYIRDVQLQADGKILLAVPKDVGGNSTAADEIDILRFNADGTADTAFGSNGVAKVSFGLQNYYYTSYSGGLLNVTNDGKIIVGGKVGYDSGGNDGGLAIARLNADGTLDATFDSTAHYVRGGSAVVLDSDVRVYAQELKVASGFNNAVLTLTRHGGANTEDIFSSTGTLGALTQGGTLTIDGTTIGTVLSNQNGILELKFNSSAWLDDVNKAIEQIGYANSSTTFNGEVIIDWTLAYGTVSTMTGSSTVLVDANSSAWSAPTTVPVFTSANTVTVAENSAVTTSIYDASVQGGDQGITYTIGGTDAALFWINPENGQLYFKTSPDFEIPTDSDHNNIYAVDITATDMGSSATQALNVTVSDDTTEVTGPLAIIDLDINGQLIKPVEVDGKVYYFWDVNKNGVADVGDSKTHTSIEGLFRKDINGVFETTSNKVGSNLATDDTFRYGTINGVDVALPGHGYGSAVYSANLANNQTYSDYSEIWDTFNSAAGGEGIPQDWISGTYWTASLPSFGSGHSVVTMTNGSIAAYSDGNSFYIALQVL